MRCLAWNCRGLGNPQTVRALQKILKRENPEVVFLMETISNNVMMDRIRRQCKIQGMFNVAAKESSGGIVIYGCIRCGRKAWRLTSFYGKPATRNRKATWDLLRTLGEQNGGAWLSGIELHMAKRENGIKLCSRTVTSYNGGHKRDKAKKATVCVKIQEGSSRPRGEDNSLRHKVEHVLDNLKKWRKKKAYKLGIRIEKLYDGLRAEAVYWKQRAHIDWLREGNKNTRFFHSQASERRRKNRVNGMEDKAGKWLEDDLQISRHAADYFK
ncbi:uncharacterized protein LOC111293286 [Durio zibethinus]|uniref:Uncharacterized protein LOC111293286 n=1 Tax=Durio zibethinus TaxID=66656 RepID=A0A6P5YNW1_DURZI|nr:uncharacterized protein LOC111293286 [Durio zibethinus]